ncbi:MAG: DUF4783 domain-containing protein [Bacteroidales bacterium]|nr:DUF4783 domain-containing protein [Bacteroidales bacterium]
MEYHVVARLENCSIFVLLFQHSYMRHCITGIFTAVAMILSTNAAEAQDNGYDVFNPIAKYITQGDAEKLSAWFSDNLEVTIFSDSNDSSRNQAREILKSFFRSYTPRSFNITHKAGRSNMKYALGTLNAGGELFVVTIFVGYNDSSYKIQHIKIERIN